MASGRSHLRNNLKGQDDHAFSHSRYPRRCSLLAQDTCHPVDNSAKWIAFEYKNLLRVVARRVLLRDGWNLKKIAEHLDQSPLHEIADLLPRFGNKALATLRCIRRDGLAAAGPLSMISHLSRAAAMWSFQYEIHHALERLGLPEEEPAAEALTLMAITPWFHALVESGRNSEVTLDEAEEIGRTVTASLLKARGSPAERNSATDRLQVFA